VTEVKQEHPDTDCGFQDLGLSEPLLRALGDVGYERPTPIQARCIPPLLDGKDLLGVAQTGTGKTAAFVLPLLSRLELKQVTPQILVLTPTRELAIQVAEAVKTYGRYLSGLRILPVYGGQGMDLQLRQLRRGVHVVVGTPGRVQDHLRRRTLKLGGLSTVVLDEADEMLRMGFLEEVTEILDQTPEDRQTALFSATMPAAIQRVAGRYLQDPKEIRIKSKTTTVETVNQRYWRVQGVKKIDALTRILEAEEFDAVLVFARTKNSTAELAERLEARGYAAAALNGDMNQAMRERTVDRLKAGKIDLLVATDVAARGLDVPRISHVVNFDIPYDTESYVHRIGRTGRAGRTGEAILFVNHRERRMLLAIERATRQKILPMDLPTRADVSARRVERFKAEVAEALKAPKLDLFAELVKEIQEEQEVEPQKLLAAMACLAQRERPLDLGMEPEPERIKFEPSAKAGHKDSFVEVYRVEVGRRHGMMPGNLVGAIAGETGLESRFIGRIDLQDEFSLVELPGGMPPEVMKHLRDVVVCGVPLAIHRVDPALMKKRRPRGHGEGSRGFRTHHHSSSRATPGRTRRFDRRKATGGAGRGANKYVGPRNTGKPATKSSGFSRPRRDVKRTPSRD
jgi:ATP-dependent RNA helicase DeaD